MSSQKSGLTWPKLEKSLITKGSERGPAPASFDSEPCSDVRASACLSASSLCQLGFAASSLGIEGTWQWAQHIFSHTLSGRCVSYVPSKNPFLFFAHFSLVTCLSLSQSLWPKDETHWFLISQWGPEDGGGISPIQTHGGFGFSERC